MAMQHQSAIDAMIADAEAEEKGTLVRVETPALEAITRSEIAMQLEAAHRYPRTMSTFLKRAQALATKDVEVAEACFYSLPRMEDGKQKMIQGPSVRLAEICATTWGNIHAGARIVDETEKVVVAQGMCWDLEANYRTSLEITRPIMNKYGKRYPDHMIELTKNAACAIAYRNAVFKVVPFAYVKMLFVECRSVAVGDDRTFEARRGEVLARLGKMGVPTERVLARLEIKDVLDIDGEMLATLIGLGTAIKGGELSIDDAFPAPAPAVVPDSTPQGQRVKLPGKGKATSNDNGEQA